MNYIKFKQLLEGVDQEIIKQKGDIPTLNVVLKMFRKKGINASKEMVMMYMLERERMLFNHSQSDLERRI